MKYILEYAYVIDFPYHSSFGFAENYRSRMTSVALQYKMCLSRECEFRAAANYPKFLKNDNYHH